jgi:hypothetical protein
MLVVADRLIGFLLNYKKPAIMEPEKGGGAHGIGTFVEHRSLECFMRLVLMELR